MKDIRDLDLFRLCSGCGACAYVAPHCVQMIDVNDEGLRPEFRPDDATAPELVDAFRVCPGVSLGHEASDTPSDIIQDLSPAWGPILSVWEGSAGDQAIRFAGSSGGAATALALFCLEQEGMHGVLHVKARTDLPYKNETVMSRTREDLLSATGSRYAPASPCDRLQLIEDAPAPCVFIGKPCDVAATRKARRLRPQLDEKLGLTIGFFCAGTPSTEGTLQLLKRMGIDDPDDLVSLRYRGNGWPGKATAVLRTADGLETRELTYEESWGEVLSNHQQWRCKVCADHTGEFADIAVGDPWYRTIQEGEAGESLILARTPRGAQILNAAAAAGYLNIRPADPAILPASQPNLLRVRGAVWGRILVCRLLGIAAPKYTNMPTYRHWMRELTWVQKARSIGGTLKRALRGRVKVAPSSY